MKTEQTININGAVATRSSAQPHYILASSFEDIGDGRKELVLEQRRGGSARRGWAGGVPALRLLALIVILVVQAIAQQSKPAAAPANDNPQHAPEINTTLMETTFLISGPSAKVGEEDKMRFGTGFVMLRSVKVDSDMGQYVLVTAKHVFDDIKGEQAIIMLRKRNNSGDAVPFAFALRIRDKDKNLYSGHPRADVAVIDIALPNDTIVVQLGPQITNINWLATDEFLKDINIHPNDELSCLGYPLRLAANDAGYPILRSGKIASYPVIPLNKTGRILYDFQVQPGNSGGPVYFAFTNRPYKGQLAFGTVMTYQKLLGLVIQKSDPVNGVDPFIAVVVPSIYIKETIDQLSGFVSKIKEDQ